ncbi:bifunctional ADP-dependent NAD(P)H-hydrate dehydratase/NAD(P)H-hydrate epimerase [Georgenia ruanii]|uniref:Bifunctional NAD(P)H-hydrate repair enzyme n=1 Tax=Georgenia ruanii TaxID=348442 RepID=A0A7J9US86_9MICO|nr:bifunctional ADP-dependent NAD(P)H-hydrate dehydratase/NAD(P)H-hydrate epimerase [Georgenia ruanii]MPV87468.1 bifunctional ADP-dependent (S)-NAD(P)H-hydrate dehydratase/NAD(P)H-hydrate epimerase [Georgenia ruanii]
MIRAHTVAAVREAEAPRLTAGEPLMARAAFALATRVAAELRERGHRVSGSVVLLLVGGGNNGGDALFAGTHLARRGCQVHAALLGERPPAAGLAAARAAGVRVHEVLAAPDVPGAVVALARAAGVWVDGLTGIGARGPLRAPLTAVVGALAAEKAASPDEPVVVAVDVPSGIGVDDGALPGPVLPADVTVTMGTAKPGLLLPPAAAVAGRVEVVDLGLDGDLAAAAPAVCRLAPADVADLWPVPGPADQKYTRGVLGVVAGSQAFPGAAVLAVAGAVGAGLGMVRYRGPEVPTGLVHARHPEVVAAPGRVQAWVIGSGIDPDDAARTQAMEESLAAALAARLPVALDAGGLSLVHDDGHPDLPATVVLTPHAGELATLLTARGEEVTRADVEAAPARHARLAAEITGATVLLKGAATVVAAPDGPLYAQADATPWLATAGAGDVLAGVLGALLAGYGDAIAADEEGRLTALPARLAAAAALVHGRAARRAAGQGPDGSGPGAPITAQDVAAALPGAVGALLR